MTSKDDEQFPQPTDQSGAGIPGVDQDASQDNDTEGHSLLNVELARSMNQDRAREVARLDRDSARARDAKSNDGGGFFKRFGRR
jgi:hypothetical protein